MISLLADEHSVVVGIRTLRTLRKTCTSVQKEKPRVRIRANWKRQDVVVAETRCCRSRVAPLSGAQGLRGLTLLSTLRLYSQNFYFNLISNISTLFSIFRLYSQHHDFFPPQYFDFILNITTFFPPQYFDFILNMLDFFLNNPTLFQHFRLYSWSA